MKILIVLFLVIIVGSLFTALYTLVKDRGESDRTVKALTLRVLRTAAFRLQAAIDPEGGFEG